MTNTSLLQTVTTALQMAQAELMKNPDKVAKKKVGVGAMKRRRKILARIKK